MKIPSTTDLDKDQGQALEALRAGSVIVLAGPGSGKTHTLVAAIRSTLALHPDSHMLCLTFTNRAASSLQERLGGQQPLFVGTFHALAARLLQATVSERQIIDDGMQALLLSRLKQTRDLPETNSRELGLIISRFKNGSLQSDSARELTAAYDAELAKRQLLDYDDLILQALEVAVDCPPYDYIFIDEFQDTSPKQYELLRALSGAATRLFVIGDPKQSIYRFRGVDGSIFDRLRAESRPAVIALRRNYRSTNAVVTAGNAVFPDQPAQIIVRPESGAARSIETFDEYSEADYIARAIQQSLGGTDWRHTHHDTARLDADRFGDFAILYRTRRQGHLLAQKLRAADLPIQCLGEDSPYASTEVRLIKALLAYAYAPSTETHTSLLGAAKLAKLAIKPALLRGLDSSLRPLALVQAIAERLGRTNDEAIILLENLAARFQDTPALLAQLDSLATQAFFDPQADAVCLSTIHASKGLEFRHVFVAGCVQGLLPGQRAITADDLAEERRLFYVAITRARDSLLLLHSRRRAGQAVDSSSFLPPLSLPIEVDDRLAATERTRSRRQQQRAQQSLF